MPKYTVEVTLRVQTTVHEIEAKDEYEAEFKAIEQAESDAICFDVLGKEVWVSDTKY